MTAGRRMRTGRRILRVLAGAGLALLAAEAIMVAVFRSKWRPAIDVVRRFNKLVLNPAMLRMAGSEHWYASVVRHVGRRSGRSYATPVVASRAGDHLYIPLPYGTRVDWCANVLAAGGCVLEHRGERFETGNPVIVAAAEAAPTLSGRARRVLLGLFGVDSFLRLEVGTPSLLRPAEADSTGRTRQAQ